LYRSGIEEPTLGGHHRGAVAGDSKRSRFQGKGLR
jgi:hypothetical protein